MLRKASNGTTAEELLYTDGVTKAPRSVSPDGKWLLYDRPEQKSGNDLWILPLTAAPGGAKAEPQVFLQTKFNESRGRFSPDRKWVAYVSDESGIVEVYVTPFPGPGNKRQISNGGGTWPIWRRDGTELFHAIPGGQLVAVELSARNGALELGNTQKLFDGIITTRGQNYDATADGQKFLVTEDTGGSSLPLTILQNWPATLKK